MNFSRYFALKLVQGSKYVNDEHLRKIQSDILAQLKDSKNNHTRFVVLSLLENKVKSKNDKTSILVNLTDGHGVLAKFLQEFHDAKINLTK